MAPPSAQPVPQWSPEPGDSDVGDCRASSGSPKPISSLCHDPFSKCNQVVPSRKETITESRPLGPSYLGIISYRLLITPDIYMDFLCVISWITVKCSSSTIVLGHSVLGASQSHFQPKFQHSLTPRAPFRVLGRGLLELASSAMDLSGMSQFDNSPKLPVPCHLNHKQPKRQ